MSRTPRNSHLKPPTFMMSFMDASLIRIRMPSRPNVLLYRIQYLTSPCLSISLAVAAVSDMTQ